MIMSPMILSIILSVAAATSMGLEKHRLGEDDLSSYSTRLQGILNVKAAASALDKRPVLVYTKARTRTLIE